MNAMQALRASRLLTSWVLAWFALFLGTAVAASVVAPEGVQWVCSPAGGAKLLDAQGEDFQPQTASMDCPLCAFGATLPPNTAASILIEASAQTQAMLNRGHPVWLVAPPLPSRGPPVSLALATR
jgi:hypothetical protein